MIGPISSSVRSGPSESTSSSIAGSVLTIGIGRPAPSSERARNRSVSAGAPVRCATLFQYSPSAGGSRSEEHTSELQSRLHLVCRLLLEKKKHTRNLQSPLTNPRANHEARHQQRTRP